MKTRLYASWEQHGQYDVELIGDVAVATYPGTRTENQAEIIALLILELRSQQARNMALEFASRWAGKARSDEMRLDATETLDAMRSLSDEDFTDDFLARTRLMPS